MTDPKYVKFGSPEGQAIRDKLHKSFLDYIASFETSPGEKVQALTNMMVADLSDQRQSVTLVHHDDSQGGGA